MVRLRRKWARRLRDAWRGLRGKAYQPPIDVRFAVNGLTIMEATSEELYLMAKWGGADAGQWREMLTGDIAFGGWPMGTVLQKGDRVGLFVRWDRG